MPHILAKFCFAVVLDEEDESSLEDAAYEKAVGQAERFLDAKLSSLREGLNDQVKQEVHHALKVRTGTE